MSNYPVSFETAVSHCMLYEVGGHWDSSTPGVEEGLIGSAAQRRAVGYVNDPQDRGGETKFGVAKNANPDIDITALTWSQAKDIYHTSYWLASRCDKITVLAPRLAALHFDGAINHGVGRANRFLQRAIRAGEDGAIGAATLKALDGALASAGEISLCNLICDMREDFYEEIIRRNPPQVRFREGWLRRIREMREFVTKPESSFV